ncbi:YoaK family protein [Pararhizobium mangrovi]|uniref:DUF1275 domain-containing protein n=1 Tax=Pararhizobium mangrovi TaxID=2590452 RepID=A0A506U4J5_9HYPH|nr:YoaK family protein [Pararhizobium mangrovi]TPW29293.1 DUF1275 domain-containing protein [Pararhizobium mangrovi]
MKTYAKRHWALACGIAALAGYVDAVGYLRLNGFFVSFMSGNSTRFAVGVATWADRATFLAFGIILCFVVGVIVGTLLAVAAGRWRMPIILTVVAAVLAVSLAADLLLGGLWLPLIAAGAMGAVNCVFLRDGTVSIGVTYMTGTLVKFGQSVAQALLGHDRFGWVPYLFLWSALTVGAVLGAVSYRAFDVRSLIPAVVFTAALAIYARWLGPSSSEDHRVR